jgi:cobalt-zinc-cadmium efflux system protein
VGLNVGYVLVEAAAGFVTGSLALLADAAHNLTDVAGLLIAWGAAVLAKRAGTQASEGEASEPVAPQCGRRAPGS